MAFPVDSNFFEQYSPLYGEMDLAGIQNPKPDIIDKFQDDVMSKISFKKKVFHICFVMVKGAGIMNVPLDSLSLLKLGC